jgi:HEPN domain-containing protein
VPEPILGAEAQSLLAAAKRDALAFELLSTEPEAPQEVLFFLAQQAIEKGIKSVLAQRCVAYRKTHDLVELAELLDEDELLAALPMDLMIRLGPYAVQMRYANVQTPHVTLQEVRSSVTGVLSWVQRAI